MSRSGAVAELKLQLRSYGTLRMHRVVRWLPDTSLAMCVRILANDMTNGPLGNPAYSCPGGEWLSIIIA